MYCDLNIAYSDNQSNLYQLLTSAICDGYRLLAINANTANLQQKTHNNQVPLAISSDTLKSIYEKYSIQFLNCLNSTCIDWNKIKIYKRLTIELNDQKDIFVLTNPIQYMKEFDILAVKPMNEKMLEVCLSSDINCDVIVLNLDEKLNLMTKKHLLLSATEKDVFFEIEYSSFVANNESRSGFISNFLMLFEILKGKNITFSSGASTFFQHRSPFDLTTIIQTLFDIKNDIAKPMISENCEKIILKSIQRGLYKNTLEIHSLNETKK